MESDYQVDSLDQKILRRLVKDARTPFTDIARDLLVATGTVHQRVEKMKNAGVIKGFQATLNHSLLGRPVMTLVGIHLNNAKDCASVYEALEKFKEVVEVHFTTGTYALIAKIVSGSVQEFHNFLTEKLHVLKSIRATETFLCLNTPIQRPIEP
jgi:Lrp/AsnC family transcriptional regulator, regulator for asnA, asnC and gidA